MPNYEITNCDRGIVFEVPGVEHTYSPSYMLCAERNNGNH